MIPLETIIQAVGSAKVYYLQLLNALLVELKKGCTGDINKLQCILWLINALEYDIKGGVNDEITQENYVKLLKQMDGFSGSYVLDPNVVYPEVAIGLVQVNWGNIVGNIYNQIDLIALIGALSPELADGVITAGEITIDEDSLATFVEPFTYRLNTVVHTPTQQTLQLDPNGTENRIDLIVGNSDGEYEKVTGIETVSPIIPNPPPNTLVLAQIYRFSNGTNLIVVNDEGGYYQKVGGSIFGNVIIENGNNLLLRAAVGSVDTGDIIGVRGDGTIKWRLYNELTNKELRYKLDEDVNQDYEIIHSGNLGYYTVSALPIEYSDLESDHKTYLNTDLVDKDFGIFQNSISRFLNSDEYTIIEEGGFELTYELTDGDSLRLIGESLGFAMNGNVSEVYNALDRTTPGAVLDARQGKALAEGIATLDEKAGRIYYNYTNKYPVSIRVWQIIGGDPYEYLTDYDWEEVKNVIPSTTCYVDPLSGLDSNDGSESTPFKTLTHVLNNTNFQDWKLKAGSFFDRANGLLNTELSREVKISSYGVGEKPKITVHDTHVGWVIEPLSSGTTWKVSETTAVRTLIDLTQLNEYGVAKPLVRASVSTECYATPGSYYQNAGMLYVHTLDGRQPDNSILTSYQQIGIRSASTSAGSPKNFYFEGIEIWGGNSVVAIQNTDLDNVKNCVMKDCNLRYSSDDASSNKGNVFVAFNNCNIQYGYDCFDYTELPSSSGNGAVGFEFNCFAAYASNRINASTVGDACNGSTAHDNSKVLRVGGLYTKTEGRVIADIESSVSVNLGVTATNPIGSKPFWNNGFGMGSIEIIGTSSVEERGFYQLINCYTDGCYRSYERGVNDLLEVYNHTQTEPVNRNYDPQYPVSRMQSTGQTRIITVRDPDSAIYKSSLSGVTGAIKIKLPSSSQAMYAIKGTIFQYDTSSQTNRSCTFLITAYSNSMSNGCSAVFFGGNTPNYPVRWYTDGSNPAVYIGDVGSSWSSVAVSIDDVQVSYTGADLIEGLTGFAVTMETVMTGTLAATRTNNLPKVGLDGSVSLNFPSTVAGAVSDLTVSCPGAMAGDIVAIGVPPGSVTATGVYFPFVSATDIVTVRFSPKATEDPAAGVFKVKILK